VFLAVTVSAAGAVALLLVVRRLRQTAGQGTAAAVAERAGQRAIAEGDDATLEHADGTVVPPALTEGEADADAEVLDEPVQILAGRHAKPPMKHRHEPTER
jgi:hypothetical protein